MTTASYNKMLKEYSPLLRMSFLLAGIFLIVYSPIIALILLVLPKNQIFPEKRLQEETVIQESKSEEVKIRSTGEFSTGELESEILEVLGAMKGNYSIYIKLLGSNWDYGYEEDALYFPGSIYKVPIAILVLRDIENGKYSLNSELVLKEENKKYTTDVMYNYETGSTYSISKLLYYMIHYSDNTSWDMLQDNIGTTATIDARFRDELSLEYTRRVPFQTTAREVGQIFEGLYYYRYLNEENSEYLLNLLSDIVALQNDRIPAGVPKGVKVSHKIGNWTGIWQDGGIVYSEERDYVIVVLNKNSTVSSAQTKIKEISRITWDFFHPTEE